MPAMTARTRWLLGGGAVVGAVAIVAAAVVVLGSRPAPEAMTYIPSTSAVVAELRPDFPGDQLSRVGNLLAHFPGFKDQSILGQKLDETLAKLTTAASNGSVDYTKQVKPWLAGPLYAAGSATALSGGAGVPGGSSPTPGGPGESPHAAGDFVTVFTTDGSVTCDPFTGTASQVETYRDVTIHEANDKPAGACAIDGRQAIVGTLAFVKAALDAHATHQGIDAAADYRTARDRLGGDRLATVYLSRSAIAGGQLGGLASALPTIDPAVTRAFQALPAWMIAGVRAEDSALVADLVSAPFSPTSLLSGGSPAPGASPAPLASLLTPPPAHASQLAGLLPADTAVVAEAHGAGVALQNLVAQLRSMPQLAGSLGQLDATLGTLGGASSLVDWLGDAGVVVLPDGQSVTGGLVLLAPDAATAQAKVDQLRGLLALAGVQAGISVTDTTIDGTKVTLVDLGDASTLLGQAAGAAGGLGGLTIPAGTHVVVSIAAHGSAVLVGAGESFARRILDTATGSTLADQASYKAAIGLATAQNDGQLYVAAGPILAVADGAIPAADKARYESDIKPYLAPLDAFLETTTMDAGGLRVRLVLTVK